MATGSYIIRGGLPGRERLRLLARVMRPATLGLLQCAGVAPGMRCLDIGCGGGDVAIELARMVGPDGHVAAIDFDPVKIELACEDAAAAGLSNVAFAVADLVTELEALPPADLVYARFVLTHLREPEAALARMAGRLAPGGLLILEDIEISGHVVHPPSPAHDAFVDLYRRAARLRGADPDIGPRLPGMLQAAGMVGVQARIAQPLGLDGEMKQVSLLTMEAIADAVLAAGLAGREQVDAITAELARMAADPGTLLSIARVVQSWARKPS
jgi:predicted O-methyltransferase YrrM